MPTESVEVGYWLSSEEHAPDALVRHARRAEESGFRTAMISDHFHPWTSTQGQSPFVWGVLGAIAGATETLRVGTGVTCPIMRIHPAIVAHAAATAACLMPGRFFLGVGSGERLNEHVVGYAWPSPAVRLEMLEEAVTIIRKLWKGGCHSHRGRFFTVDRARIYSRPEQPPPIYVAATTPRSAKAVAKFADGLVCPRPSAPVVHAFEEGGGASRPRVALMKVCWAETEAEARRTALRCWPVAAIGGAASSELAIPLHYEQLAQRVTEDDVARVVPCGPDPERHRAAITRFAAAGYHTVYVHQIGPDQEGFFRFCERDLLPSFASAA